LQTIIKELKIHRSKHNDITNFSNSKELILQTNVILTNPSVYSSNDYVLDEYNKEFLNIGNNINYIELISNDLFYIKLNNIFILQTKYFNYLNHEHPLLSVEILNGGCCIDSEELILVGYLQKEISINSVIASNFI